MAEAATTAEPVGPSQAAGENVLLVLRELADYSGDWWLWEPAQAREVGPGRALRVWWSAALEVVDAEETAELEQSTDRASECSSNARGMVTSPCSRA
ncbi:hypothetical protein M4D79_02475 [Mycolicibacterium novocastrense]|nr:hypothetical protein M4D79_02475 [Mycolicibacterium novocastrense]